MAWNDRANRVLLQQAFFRVEKAINPAENGIIQWGFRSDWIVGTDYRFTLPRGIWNGQLVNSTDAQNLYGVDPVEFYGEAYIPNVQQGLDIKVGRWYAPYGEESIEAVSTPLVSRSYTFNSGPEFTNTGILATLTVNPEWTACGGYAIGNDNFFDAGDEGRFVGYVKWTQPGSAATPPYGRNTLTLATTLGRGKFNEGAPSELPQALAGDVFTVSNILPGETAGRNNINVVDLLYTHTFNPVLNYAMEALYGWQTNIPCMPQSAASCCCPAGRAWSATARPTGRRWPITCSTPCRRGPPPRCGPRSSTTTTASAPASRACTRRSRAAWRSSCGRASSSAPSCGTTTTARTGPSTRAWTRRTTSSPPPAT